MAFLASLSNHTPFAAQHLLLPDGEGGELILVVVKASLEFTRDGRLVIADEPTPVRPADEFRGQPGASGLRHDHDLAEAKPRVDLLVHGRAYAPYGELARDLLVELRVGELHKALIVCGDRRWEDGQPSAPAPFESLELCWERAFGGTRDRETVDGRNPVGVGYARARSADPEILSELPNIEYPDQRVQSPDDRKPAPAGFGPVARAWSPRRELAGTFDQAWKARRWPLRPRDYDPAHNQAAPADQQLDHYPAGAEVALTNLSPAGIWVFRLPHFDVPLNAFYDDRWTRPQLRVDTVEIDAEERTLALTARVALPVDRRRPPLRELVLGHMQPGWLRAKHARKCYVDLRGTGGVDLRKAYVWT